MRVGINGLGRIGKAVLRHYASMLARSQNIGFKIVAVNCGVDDVEKQVHFLKYDSTYGKLEEKISSHGRDSIMLCNQKISFYSERDPKKLNWGINDEVEVILDCTGAFRTREKTEWYFESNPALRYLIVSSPAETDITVVYGVNHNSIDSSKHRTISASSCTTNCLANLIMILQEYPVIESGFMTTVHAYTNDQRALDHNHHDLYRARSCLNSIIPTTTGAATEIAKLFPSLESKITGAALRVPVSNVSLLDFTFVTQNPVKNANVLNEHVKNFVTTNKTNSFLQFCDEKLVSIDYLGNTASAVIDLKQTYTINERMCRVVAWYDNEKAFAIRMLDIVAYLVSG